MTTPRDFHIGDEVRIGGYPKPCWIRAAHKLLVWIEVTGAAGLYMTDEYPVGDLVHASDGAPLGEFVPLAADAIAVLDELGDYDGLRVPYAAEQLNAIIKGETT